MKNAIRFSLRLTLVLSMLFLMVQTVSADVNSTTVNQGTTDYSWGAESLREMVEEIGVWMTYVVGLLYSIAAIFAVYNAMVIYIKIQTGEPGIIKSILMLVGAAIFLISATRFMPALFGYKAILG